MTLRQQYARPRPRAISRHQDQPGQAAAPAHTGPAGISPPHQPGLGARLLQQPSQPSAGSAHRRAQAWSSARSRGRATGWTSPRGNASPAAAPFPAARACHGELPLPPAPGTAGVCHRRPACGLRRWIPIQRAVAAGSRESGRFLWVSCGHPAGRHVWWGLSPLVMVGPAATAAAPDQRQAIRHNPATPPRRPQCTRPIAHQIAQTPTADLKRVPRPRRAPAPARQTSSTGGTWKRQSPGPAPNGCAVFGTGYG